MSYLRTGLWFGPGTEATPLVGEFLVVVMATVNCQGLMGVSFS